MVLRLAYHWHTIKVFSYDTYSKCLFRYNTPCFNSLWMSYNILLVHSHKECLSYLRIDNMILLGFELRVVLINFHHHKPSDHGFVLDIIHLRLNYFILSKCLTFDFLTLRTHKLFLLGDGLSRKNLLLFIDKFRNMGLVIDSNRIDFTLES